MTICDRKFVDAFNGAISGWFPGCGTIKKYYLDSNMQEQTPDPWGGP